MKARFTDIHHHILCGMDDGAKNHKMMYAMLALAAKDGVSRIVATPHVTPGVQRFDRERYRKILGEANAYCQEKGLDMTLLEGGELLYTPHTCRFLNDGEVPMTRWPVFGPQPSS